MVSPGIFLNHGQACCAGSRVFVHEKVYDQFKEKFLAHVKTLKVGNPFEADTFQGPQISQIQYDVSLPRIETRLYTDGPFSGSWVTLTQERLKEPRVNLEVVDSVTRVTSSSRPSSPTRSPT